MAKSRTLDEIRQSKEFQQAVKSKTVDTLGRTDVAVDEIVDTLTTHMFDIIFEAVNDEMHKYTVFRVGTYFTEEGINDFEDAWFEFYHEHHGDIMNQLMNKITN